MYVWLSFDYMSSLEIKVLIKYNCEVSIFFKQYYESEVNIIF